MGRKEQQQRWNDAARVRPKSRRGNMKHHVKDTKKRPARFCGAFGTPGVSPATREPMKPAEMRAYARKRGMQ